MTINKTAMTGKYKGYSYFHSMIYKGYVIEHIRPLMSFETVRELRQYVDKLVVKQTMIEALRDKIK